MNREIVFRGKDDANKWHFGGYFKGEFGDEYIIENQQMILADNESVGEFTGFKDDSEKKIFEDDLLQNVEKPEKIGRIIRFNGCWFVSYPDGQEPCLCGVLDYAAQKVIGNIHDTPELLEGGKE